MVTMMAEEEVTKIRKCECVVLEILIL